jgi:hypothetical protein
MNTCVPLPEGGTPDASDGSSVDVQVDAVEGGSTDSGEAGAPEGGQADTPDAAEASPTNDGLSEDGTTDTGNG